MDEKGTPRDWRSMLNDETGMTRRDLMRRGAIVGGTLLWVAPAIQSVSSKAYAAVQGPSPGTCAACYCWNGPKQNPTVGPGGSRDNGTIQGQVDDSQGLFSNDDCENWCKHNPASVGGPAPGGPYESHEYCSGTSCTINTSASMGTNGAFCT